MAPSILQQPVRAAIYARISTTNHGQDIGLQTRELLQFAEVRGWKVVSSYEDAGILTFRSTIGPSQKSMHGRSS